MPALNEMSDGVAEYKVVHSTSDDDHLNGLNVIPDFQASALAQPGVNPLDVLGQWVEQNANAVNQWIKNRSSEVELFRNKFIAFMPMSTVAVPVAPTREKTDFIPKEMPKVKNLRFRVEDGKAELLWDVEDGAKLGYEEQSLAVDLAAKRRYFVGGNWKAAGNKLRVESFCKLVDDLPVKQSQGDVVVAPPVIYAGMMADKLKQSKIDVAAQDISKYGPGAYTGQTNAEMLKDIGVEWAIVGHSEHRKIFSHSDFEVGCKVKHALDNSMNVILCVGECQIERLAGRTNQVTTRMLDSVTDWIAPEDWNRVVICYEPVWVHGIEGGKVAPSDAQKACINIRDWVKNVVHKDIGNQIRVIYGGEVDSAAAKDFIKMPDIDGFLIGKQSLTSEFATIVETVQAKH